MGSATRPIADTPTRSRLLESAAQAVAELGLDGVTARTIGARAGVSASAINYAFGSLEELLAVTLSRVRQEDNQWRGEILQSIARHPGRGSFAALLQATVDIDSRERRHAALVRSECRLAGLRGSKYARVAHAWYTDEVQFWAAALKHFGLDSECAPLVQESALAIAKIHYCGSPSMAQVAWVNEALARFAQRLQGKAPEPAGEWRDFLTRPENEGVLRGGPGRSDTEQKILDGAIKVILRSGAGGLTHRAVAAAADVSLSSTTYYFAGRDDLLRAAFGALRFSAASRARAVVGPPQSPLDPAAYSQQVAALLVEADGTVSSNILSLQYLLHAGYRDPMLRAAASNAYASLGMTTRELLSRVPGLGAIDRLDAFLLASWTSNVLQVVGHVAPLARRSWLRDRHRDTLRRLFKV